MEQMSVVTAAAAKMPHLSCLFLPPTPTPAYNQQEKGWKIQFAPLLEVSRCAREPRSCIIVGIDH